MRGILAGVLCGCWLSDLKTQRRSPCRSRIEAVSGPGEASRRLTLWFQEVLVLCWPDDWELVEGWMALWWTLGAVEAVG